MKRRGFAIPSKPPLPKIDGRGQGPSLQLVYLPEVTHTKYRRGRFIE